MAKEDPIPHILSDLIREARALADHAEEALDHYQEGKLQEACDVTALSHYKLGEVAHARSSALAEFEKRGLEPGARR